MRLVGTCGHKFSSKPGDICGRTLMETDTLGWLGHASPVAVHHYPVLRPTAAPVCKVADAAVDASPARPLASHPGARPAAERVRRSLTARAV